MAVAAANLLGEVILRGYEFGLERDIEEDRKQVNSYEGAAVFEETASGNAADFYRKALDEARRMDSEVFDAVHEAATAGFQDYRAVGSLSQKCEASALVIEGVRRRQIDWGLRDGATRLVTLGEYMPQVRFLAECLILEGHVHAREQHWLRAAERYLVVMRFGADFGPGDLIMDLAGIGIATAGLNALAHLIVALPEEDQPYLAGVLDALSALEPSLASIDDSLRLERLRLSYGAITVARARPLFAENGIWFPFPYLKAAKRILEEDAMLREVEQIAKTPGQSNRTRLGKAIMLHARPDALLPTEYFSHWIYALASAEDVRARIVTVGTAVRVELFRQKSERYPKSLAELGGITGSAELLYELADGGHGYVISSIGRDGTHPVGTSFRMERKSYTGMGEWPGEVR
jgi:hypothetical protein